MPCCMPSCDCVLDKNLCAYVSSGAAMDMYLLHKLIAGIPRFLEDDKFKKRGTSSGIWELQDYAGGFQT